MNMNLISLVGAGGLIGLVAGGAVLVLLILYLIVGYNRLVRARIKVDNSWSQIDVQLKLRADLVPNLVETVRGYARHEQETLNGVMETRSRYLTAQTPDGAVESGGALGSWVGRLFAVAEQYPELKADANFRHLQGQLADIEQHIALTRQFYNDAVMLYNRRVALFPANLVALLFGFKKRPYFDELTQADRQATRVSF